MRNGIALFIGGAAVAALVSVDAVPALHGVPLLLLATCAAVQIGRELANALPQHRVYPSAPVMNFLSCIILVHMALFRGDARSGALELLGAVLVAMFTLVVVAAVSSDLKCHGWGPGLRDTALSFGLSILLSGGLGCALLLQADHWSQVTAEGSRLVALVLIVAWLGCGAAAAANRANPHGGEEQVRPRLTVVGDLARLLVSALAAAAGSRLLLPRDLMTLQQAAMLGAACGLAMAYGERVVARLAAWCEIDTFRATPPQQGWIALVQRTYERFFPGGLTDYAAALVVAYPVAFLYCHLVLQ